LAKRVPFFARSFLAGNWPPDLVHFFSYGQRWIEPTTRGVAISLCRISRGNAPGSSDPERFYLIPSSKVREVRRLLAEYELSQRKIAKVVGISRGTVNAIASGKRRDRPDDDDFLLNTGPKVRCTTCGGMVDIPCRLCVAREALKNAERPVGQNDPEEDVQLELRPEHQKGYDEVREARQRQNGIDQTAGTWQEPTGEDAR
jgi:transcriptional regulator with XRE-family HTH domain